MRKPLRILFALMASAIALAATIIGCGGGGGGTTGGPVSLFLTDSMSSYQHVWVKLYQVVLTSASGQTVVYDNANGKTIDLRTLRDGGGARFQFLNRKNVPPGTYSAIGFVLDRSLSTVGSGGGSAVAKTFAPAFDTAGGKSLLSLTFGTPKALGAGDDDLVVDFDLGNWTEVGNVVTPVVVESNQSGFDDNGRHEDEDYSGTVGGLAGTAPAFTFTLNQREGGSFTVTTDANTVIFNGNGSPNPSLANGQRVEVHGKYDKTANSLLADSIKIENGQHDDRPEAKGSPSGIDANAGTFVLQLGEAEHFVPMGDTVNIATTGSTTYCSGHGQTIDRATFFKALGSTKEVEVIGTYDSSTNTLTAARARIEDRGGESDNGVEARGTFSNGNLPALTFTLTLQSWEGFSGSSGQAMPITATTAEFKNAAQVTVSAADFYALAAAPGARVKVEGDLKESAIVARECKIVNP